MIFGCFEKRYQDRRSNTRREEEVLCVLDVNTHGSTLRSAAEKAGLMYEVPFYYVKLGERWTLKFWGKFILSAIINS